MENLVPEQTGNLIPGEGEAAYDPMDAVAELEAIFDEEVLGEEREQADPEPEAQAEGDEQAEADAPEAEGEADSKGEGEDDFIATLEELAEANEADLDTLLDLTVPVEGMEEPVALKELAAFRAEHHGEMETMRQARETFDANTREISVRANRLLEAMQAEGTGYANALQGLHQTFQKQRDSEEMRTLQATDPARWAAEDRKHEQAMRVIEQGYNNARAQYEQALQNTRAEFRTQQGQILANNIEGWGQEKAVEAAEVIQNEIGFGLDEYTDVLDARMVAFALKHRAMATELAELKGKVETGEKAAKLIKRKAKKTLRTRAKQGADGQKVVNLRSRIQSEAAKRGGLSFERGMDLANELLAQEA